MSYYGSTPAASRCICGTSDSGLHHHNCGQATTTRRRSTHTSGRGRPTLLGWTAPNEEGMVEVGTSRSVQQRAPPPPPPEVRFLPAVGASTSHEQFRYHELSAYTEAASSFVPDGSLGRGNWNEYNPHLFTPTSSLTSSQFANDIEMDTPSVPSSFDGVPGVGNSTDVAFEFGVGHFRGGVDLGLGQQTPGSFQPALSQPAPFVQGGYTNSFSYSWAGSSSSGAHGNAPAYPYQQLQDQPYAPYSYVDNPLEYPIVPSGGPAHAVQGGRPLPSLGPYDESFMTQEFPAPPQQLPLALSDQHMLTPDDEGRPKKQQVACLFCHRRKMKCVAPEPSRLQVGDTTCLSCKQRKRTNCQYPAESLRGNHLQTKSLLRHREKEAKAKARRKAASESPS
ncbi:hypothetical protein C8F01DRAFT_1292369 [Mycena amicta]|nr:hypothetical protein C8F01DRAFT_1292369 [Mycena amicta]